MCDTISSRLFREMGVSSPNNLGEVSGVDIQEVVGVTEVSIPFSEELLTILNRGG